MKKYKIELTETQLQVYREALECYSRFLSGQVAEMCSAVSSRRTKRRAWDHYLDPSDPVSYAAAQLKRALFPELSPSSSYGIGYSSDEKTQLEDYRQVSYEMYREVFHYRAVKFEQESRAKGEEPSYDVYLSETLKYSDEPLAKVEEIDPE
jgi:hypothetical protein